LDGRATGMKYGATIIDALPPATRIHDLASLDELFGHASGAPPHPARREE
jgi:hypothetical protein